MVLRPEKSCPIPKTHSRLRQVHDLWHEVEFAYPDADDFVTKLNACVQAARSVTFVLQKELRHRDWFESFYEPWQQRMKADPLMRWLVEARNAIEKQGDLETHSIACVSVVTTDDEVVVADLDVPPLASPDEVAESVKIADLPERIRKQAVMVVERRWTVPELPKGELLDTLGHCYGVLASLVAKAHEQCGSSMRTFGGEAHQGQHTRIDHPSGRLPCMLPTTEMRTAYWHLGRESLLDYEIAELERPSVEELAEDVKRYGPKRRGHTLFPGMPIFDQAAAFHEIGKTILATDGYHGTYAWLYRDGRPVGQLTLYPEDHQGKIVSMRKLARRVDELGADTVIYATEVWLAMQLPASDPRFDLRAAEREDKQEAFMTYLLSEAGRREQWMTWFSRDESDHPVLGKTDVQGLDALPIFRPVERVWEAWNSP